MSAGHSVIVFKNIQTNIVQWTPGIGSDGIETKLYVLNKSLIFQINLRDLDNKAIKLNLCVVELGHVARK